MLDIEANGLYNLVAVESTVAGTVGKI